MAYYSFTKAIKEERAIQLNNKGNMFRDMTYIDDIVEGIVRSIDYVLKPESRTRTKIFNLGNNSPIKTSHLLHKIEDIIGKKALILHRETKNESLKTPMQISQKQKNYSGYDPKVSYDEGVSKDLWIGIKHYENI